LENFQIAIGGHPKPCVSGSDGHSIGSFKTWRRETCTKKTWIKADPTFEGLRQIVFEPQSRVRVQEHSPVTGYAKPFFRSISIAEQIAPFPENETFENPRFDKNESIHLNRDLVCIIGGRGTGKSTLVDYLGQAFGGHSQIKYELSQHFSVAYNKDNDSSSSHHALETTQLPFVYISQNEVKEKIDAGTVGDEIKKMLGIGDLTFNNDVDNETKKLLFKVTDINNWFEQRGEDGG